MGICLSCLGLNRHPSQDNHETDPLLDHEQGQYGGIESGDATQPDEEELRREREALEHITNDATDNMIDVVQPGTSDVSHHFAHAGSQRAAREDEASKPKPGITEETEDDDEAAWLQDLKASGADNVTAIKGLQSGDLVLDIGQLRDEPSAAKRSLKAKLIG